MRTLILYRRDIIIPEMLIKLRQWFGRGIRREKDTAVFSIFRQQGIPAWQIPGGNSEYPADHAGHGQAHGCGRLYYKEESG